ncbi:MAG: cellulase family glycosylhydrolase [Ignavibacteriales bacterium]|nr:cellulase family glycosylhydrolase [Ignavibacteriales bacterium]
MKLIRIIKILLFLLITLLFTHCAAGFSNFITAEKDQLKDGEKNFRFISYNIPNLHYIEDYMKFDAANPWRLPNEFEIRDALKAIKQTGGKATRSYVLSVRKEGESSNIIRHVLGPGKFDEDAFKALDLVMKIANEEGIRVIIPLVDNWWWWGGPKEYAAFRGKDKKEFWTDSLLISDFKKTIDFIINRKNTYTGILYKEDKALLGWETGNELQCPYSWCAEIAKYIKTIDRNHLVIQNTHVNIVAEEEIKDTNIDVVSTHYYSPGDVAAKYIKENKQNTKGKKPYYVGEFGFQPTKDIAAVLDTVIKDSVSGIMLWSLRFHNRDGGFYYHSSDNGGTAYRWPGFGSGKLFDEQNVMQLMREKAYAINNEPIPPMPIPEAPILLPILKPFEISWQGSTGASTYIIERKEEKESNWKILTDNITDAVWPYKPQFSDTSVVIGNNYTYRIKAKNESGESDWSNEVGPIKVNYKMLIDEMENDNKIFLKDGEFEFITYKQIVQAKEDRNRLSGKRGNYIIYKIPGSINSVNVEFYMTGEEGNLELSCSDNNDNYSPIIMKKKIFIPEKNEYKFFTCARYTSGELPENYRYIKIVFGDAVQIGRVSVSYKGK